MLEVRHVWKHYGGTAAVRDVSFRVDPGEVVGYLGANGSGKSTTARIVTGLLDPSRGAVLFEGKDIAADPVGYHRRLGYVPEEPSLYGYLSGREHPDSSPSCEPCRTRRFDARSRPCCSSSASPTRPNSTSAATRKACARRSC